MTVSAERKIACFSCTLGNYVRSAFLHKSKVNVAVIGTPSHS